MKNILSTTWDLFASVKTAVVLLAVIAAVSLIGTILPPQLPAVYHSPYFILLQSLLGFSLFACSLNRLLDLVSKPNDFYAWGSFFTHVSVLIIYLGAIYGGAAGFSSTVQIEKGESYLEPHGQFEIKLNDFDARFDQQGRPLSYSSDLSIVENGQEVKRQTIVVNGPLAYKGIKLYQSSYGLNAVLEVKGPGGTTEKIPVRKGGCAIYTPTGLMLCLNEIYPDLNSLPGHGKPAETYEPGQAVAYISVHEQSGGWLMLGEKINWEGYTIKLLAVKEYTGLEIKKDPGVSIVYLGFLLLIVGTGVMLYVKH